MIAMTLHGFLRENEMTEAAFAAVLGVSQVTIHRYIKGQRFPDRDMILRIDAATDGKVKPSDWFAPSEGAAA